jgi:hypothetical protein
MSSHLDLTEACFHLSGFAASPAVSTGIMVWQILHPVYFVSLPHKMPVEIACGPMNHEGIFLEHTIAGFLMRFVR